LKEGFILLSSGETVRGRENKDGGMGCIVV
jgi:hypothetical protein